MAQDPEALARWDIVALSQEAPAVVLAWVAWHLDLGASQVHLFLDDPADPVAEALAGLERVSVTRCDQTFWEGAAGHRPSRHQARQVQVATLASERSAADWILHCDCDEFVWTARKPERFLGTQSDRIGSVRLQNIERFWPEGTAQRSLFDGDFRAPMGDAGTEPGLTNAGLTGHRAGKCFSRTGRGYRVWIHSPRLEDGSTPPMRRSTAARLLHFDGFTALHWALKLLEKAEAAEAGQGNKLGQVRAAQVAALQACASLGEVMALHDRLKCPPVRVVKALEAEGLITPGPFDPGPALARWCQVTPLDWDPEAFDQGLRVRFGHLLDRYALSSA